MSAWEILVQFAGCHHARWVDSDTALDAKREGMLIHCHRCNEPRLVIRNLKRRVAGE